MSISFSIIRSLFVALAILLLTCYTMLAIPGDITPTHLAAGLAIGLVFSLATLSAEALFRKCNLRTLFVMALGLFLGVMIGESLFTLISQLPFEKEVLTIIHTALLLFTTYAGIIMTAWGADEIALSIPFVQLQAAGQKKKDLLLDLSILTDPRILDLANSGLVDGHLLVPRFLIKELQTQENDVKAKKCLETLKKLETVSGLDLRVVDQDFPEITEPFLKLLKLARVLDANLLTADINRIQQARIEGIRIINIHLLANALKPISQSGEQLDIKVQRLGKEPQQGIGYLEDGTMVVINGGADHLGKTICCQVLSVKHTASGRLIFCNAPDQMTEAYLNNFEGMEHSPSQYFVQDYERNRV